VPILNIIALNIFLNWVFSWYQGIPLINSFVIVIRYIHSPIAPSIYLKNNSSVIFYHIIVKVKKCLFGADVLVFYTLTHRLKKLLGSKYTLFSLISKCK